MRNIKFTITNSMKKRIKRTDFARIHSISYTNEFQWNQRNYQIIGIVRDRRNHFSYS